MNEEVFIQKNEFSGETFENSLAFKLFDVSRVAWVTCHHMSRGVSVQHVLLIGICELRTFGGTEI